MIKKHIPNGITCLNLFSGCIAVYYGFQGNFSAAMVAVLLSALFDFLDGFAARMLHAYSPMGKELDSLADVISFGLAPGAIAFSLLSAAEIPGWLTYSAFLIPVFSGLRLAKFNIDERQTSSFLGLPVPANAIFWIGAGYTYNELFINQPYILIVCIVVFSLLLVSEIPMFSLKFKNLKWKDNVVPFIFLIVTVILIIALRFDAPAPVIIWYIALSVALSLGKKR